MNPIAFSPLDSLVNLLQWCLIELLPVTAGDVSAVVHRQADEVESESGDHAKVVLEEGLVIGPLK